MPTRPSNAHSSPSMVGAPLAAVTKRTDADVFDFYATHGGHRMFSARHLTAPIAAYLRREVDPLEDELDFDHLVEVGCGYGRHLPWALARRLRYDGLDLVPWLIELGSTLANRVDSSDHRCRLHVRSCESLHDLWQAEGLSASGDRTVVFFPFNCFGNVARPELAVASLARTGARGFLSGFVPSRAASEARSEYYLRVGYTGLVVDPTERGVLFTSAEGLWSMAYDGRYLQSLFARHGYALIRHVALGAIATGFVFGPAARTRQLP